MSQFSRLYLYFIAVIGYVLTPVSCPRLECNYTLGYICRHPKNSHFTVQFVPVVILNHVGGKSGQYGPAKHYCAVRPSLSIQTLQIVNLQTSGSPVNWTHMVWENIPPRCFEDSNNERWRCGDGFYCESTSRDSTQRALCCRALVWVFNDLQVCDLPQQNTFARITGRRRIENRNQRKLCRRL